MRWLPWMTAAVLALALLAPSALAAGYATDERGRLYQVFPDESRTELLGTVQVTEKRDGKVVTTTPTLTDIALSDLHGLYGISFTHLYKIDMRDPAKSKRIGPLGGSWTWFNALAFDDEGRLFALESGTLYQVDLRTGRAKALGELGAGWSSDGDLAFVGGALIASVNQGPRCHLVRIDPKTWKAKDLGVFRLAPRGGKPPAGKGKDAPGGGRKKGSAPRTIDDVWGLIWDGRRLFALTPQGEVLRVDPKTAIATPLYRTRVTYYGACAMPRI